MVGAGRFRRQLERTLRTAFADGLISDRTFVLRLDTVLRARLIEPDRVIGDLHLRGPRRRVRDRLASTVHTVAGRLDEVFGDAEPGPTTLLALDWAGEQQRLEVGRSSQCNLVLDDPSVSRHHARLTHRDGKWLLQDLASTNGTFLNGQRVGRCELRPGDTVALGDARLRID